MKKKIISIILIILLLIGIYYYFKLPYVHNLLLINPKYLHTNVSGTIPANKLPDRKKVLNLLIVFGFILKMFQKMAIGMQNIFIPIYII